MNQPSKKASSKLSTTNNTNPVNASSNNPDLINNPDNQVDNGESLDNHIHLNLHEAIDQLDDADFDVPLDEDDNVISEDLSFYDVIFGSTVDQLTYADFFEGLAQLATTGVVEMTEIVEAIHREIVLRPIGRFTEEHVYKWKGGITGQVYNTIQSIMLLVGKNLATIFRLYKNTIETKKPLPKKLQLLTNVLNGVLGDHLVNNKNPLATPMQFFDRFGYPLNTEVCGRVVIITHGLCMSYLAWHPCESSSLGEKIIKGLDNPTVLYLNYNTGRRISINGHNLNKNLQKLVDKNPDITQIDLIGHSMGGLVVRSALFYGERIGNSWVKQVRNFVTLGTPHHGAVLERIGFYVQDLVSKLPYAGSLGKLGDIRSAGIIDLRHGSIRDADWKPLKGRNVLPEDFRHPAKLPRHVNTYFIASTMLEGLYASKASKFIGDGLVTVDSALGEHQGDHELLVPEGHKAVFYGISHMNLMYNQSVHDQVLKWLLSDGNDALKQRIHSYPDKFGVIV